MPEISNKLLEQLFLLEVLVDHVKLKEKKCDKVCICKKSHFMDPELPLRVRVKFINFPCFEISQEDFGVPDDEEEEEEEEKDEKRESKSKHPDFKTGKSCLFPMAPLDLVRAIKLYPVAVTVLQRDTPTSPARVLAVTKVPLVQEMIDIVMKSTECVELLPLSIDFKRSFPLVNLDGNVAGKIGLFVRLSCFGQQIVTQFQLMNEDKSFLFKSSKAETPFQCRKCFGPVCPADVDRRAFDVVPNEPYVTSSREAITDSNYGVNSRPWTEVVCLQCDIYQEGAYIPPPEDELPKFDDPPRDVYSFPDIYDMGLESLEFRVVRQHVPEMDPGHPAVRYDTTGALSPAYGGMLPSPKQNPPVRYDTTSGLSPAFEGGELVHMLPLNPPVRYDMTSALSPAAAGFKLKPDTLMPQHPGPLFTGALSSAHNHPQVRYDTTSELSPAHVAWLTPEPVEVEESVEEEEEEEEEEVADEVPVVVTKVRTKKEKRSRGGRSTSIRSSKTAESGSDSQKTKVDVQPAHEMQIKGLGGKRVRNARNRPKKKFFGKLKYPAVELGHALCIEENKLVPKRMGWLWNVDCPHIGFKYRPGWCPGAVSRAVSKLIDETKVAAGLQEAGEAPVRRRKKLATGSRRSSVDIDRPSVVMPPTLRLERKAGRYFISMQPFNADVEPLTMQVPREGEGEDILVDKDVLSSASSDFEIEFLAPGAIRPADHVIPLVNTAMQTMNGEGDLHAALRECGYFKDDPPSDKLKKKDKKKKKGKKGKKKKKEEVEEPKTE